MVIMKVNVFEIKAKLSEYLDRVLAGERVIICRHNKPVAELRAIETSQTGERPVGPLPGRPAFEIPGSFFDALPDEDVALWEGRNAAEGGSSSSSGASRAEEPRHRYTAAQSRSARKRR